MTEPDLPDSAMASGSDAGRPGDRLGLGDLAPDEQALLDALRRDVSSERPDAEAELRAAEDEVPLPADGGAPDNGLTADFSALEQG
ncbi:hypothetical protein [Blastococcus sp. SYSU D00695]